ncbi:chemotaxis protein CheA [Psychromonas marina]|uniref:Chemotaxis protein CheA n=1 Tax=Psychromonas marina TaxID=88364 RepID=A0ABQ6E4S9_9GAMM|nr:chemotaxis protein CheA [Psychromonas marina]GLS92414.1 chemotaxis protein CheA [Psychromonas marina]
MPDSTQQFDKIFFEEMTEHLEEMESLLLNMQVKDENQDAFDAIFRAAHSIKGGAGIFGFDDISSVTHILESLLDKLRCDELTLTKSMIETFLEANDLLTSLKESHQFNDTDLVSVSRVNKVCEQLKTTAGGLTITDHVVVTSTPQQTVETTADEQTELTQQEKENTKILLVEDTKVNQMVATFTLKKLGFSTLEVAEDGQQALDKLNEATDIPFNLILLDCQMPIMDGYQATRAIRKGEASEVNRHVIIIAMTAMAGEKEKQQCLTAGMDDYLIKPIDAKRVDEKIQYWINKRKNTKKAIETDQASSDNNRLQQQDVTEAKIQTQPNTVQKSPKKTTNNKNQHETYSIRVETAKVDQLINQVGELIITQSMLQKLSVDLGLNDNELLATRLSQLENNTRDLQASVMSVRMMPINTVFGRFPRIIRDLSTKLDKDIKLLIEGGQTELDKSLLEMIVDPLTHLIRNSIDHGIESPEVRLKNNKQEQGTITLSAFYRGGDVIVNVDDDGAGIDAVKIEQKARKNGMKLADKMTDNEIFQLIFTAGFSMADKVTDVSGRGVGMDVVKRNITSMGGRVEISSVLGKGSKISIHLPLTLAIIEGMSIAVGEHIYIIPLSFIVESLQPRAEEVQVLNGGQVMVLVHGHYIPVLALHQFFNIETTITQLHQGIVILLEHDSKMIALFVDALVGQQQVVLKNLENNFRKVPSISGATIMGDGKVALILDVADLVQQC